MKHLKKRLAVADDEIFLRRLLPLLEQSNYLEVVIATSNPHELLNLIAIKPIDILLADIAMTGVTGDKLAKKVKKQYPKVKVYAMFMGIPGSKSGDAPGSASIDGYVLKNSDNHQLLATLEKASYANYFTNNIDKEMLNPTENNEITGSHLTGRELQVLRLIEQEFSNRQIAESLFISERTVETHRKNIFRKTRTNNIVGLIKYIYQHKLV